MKRTFIMSIAVVIPFALLIGINNSPSKPSQKLERFQGLNEGWQSAVVTGVQDARRVLLGTLAKSQIPIDLLTKRTSQRRDVSKPPPNWSHEIWLVADGVTRGLWYSDTQQAFGGLTSIRGASPGWRDDGTVRRMVSSATPIHIQPARPSPTPPSIATYPPPPLRLQQLCSSSDVIVIGQVAGILRTGHDPENSLNRLQHTVFIVAVENYLKVDSSGEVGVRKVWQPGGSLAWQDAGTRSQGVGFEIRDDPLLNVGSRYILFLRRSPGADTGSGLGFVTATVGGVSGKVGELDEYIHTHQWYAKVLLDRGFTRAPRVTGIEIDDHWRFLDGPQILDVAEVDAITAIRQAIRS